jgi:hypothetical protein
MSPATSLLKELQPAAHYEAFMKIPRRNGKVDSFAIEMRQMHVKRRESVRSERDGD